MLRSGRAPLLTGNGSRAGISRRQTPRYANIRLQPSAALLQPGLGAAPVFGNAISRPHRPHCRHAGSCGVKGIINPLYEDNAGQQVILDYKSDAVSNDSDVQFLFIRLDDPAKPAKSTADLRSRVAEVPERVAEI